ncbi:RNA 2',3'-cyclic phosphodiesterase [Bacillus sp. NEB1478]|uniref:RNA 2',3'-cyclic phosphodiesterase n=1 Tax=Bacillus sp. NEB1478 TaxID=3073816 RepID=UPI002872FBAC|nr:RNA 2',3'-cyclic phosphodiesterase [Bacillus sp. NEB1478]WNB93091.1 RNA 2',3'-cyclic phosphodiesterase [Bacillus sp. NEB1478]
MEKHLFVALQLPEKIKTTLSEICSEVRNEASFKKWVHPSDYHITLAFLGKTEKQQLNILFPLLDEIVASFKAFELNINHFGFFGKAENPRIFWAGVEEQECLFDLQRQIAEACHEAGFSLEKRPYKPHITLSRKFNESEHSLLDENEWWKKFGQVIHFQTESIVVFETHFEKSPKYEIVQSFSLKNSL